MVPPLPIPNREVKRTSVYDTAFVGQWIIAREFFFSKLKLLEIGVFL
jgi:hypothetical protein